MVFLSIRQFWWSEHISWENVNSIQLSAFSRAMSYCWLREFNFLNEASERNEIINISIATACSSFHFIDNWRQYSLFSNLITWICRCCSETGHEEVEQQFLLNRLLNSMETYSIKIKAENTSVGLYNWNNTVSSSSSASHSLFNAAKTSHSVEDIFLGFTIYYFWSRLLAKSS